MSMVSPSLNDDLTVEDMPDNVVSYESTPESREKNSLGVRYKMPDEGLTLGQAVRTQAFYILMFMNWFGINGPGLFFLYFKVIKYTHTISFECVYLKFYFCVQNVKPFGQTFIKDDQFLAIIGSVSQVFNAAGRPFWGFLIDRLPFKVAKMTPIV